MKKVLIIIAIVGLFILAGISLNTGRIAMLCGDFNQISKELINSNLFLANSNKLLSEEIIALRKQIAELSGKVSKEYLPKKGGAE